MPNSKKMIHNCQDLIALFNSLFEHTENTVLIGNGEEPLYLPCDEKSPVNRIIFTRDYFASALHEIAHWCIASKKRRELVDYGYWYYPEGRNAEQQALFEHAEIKPQALKSIFSNAAGSSFIPSQDNLLGEKSAGSESFEEMIKARVQYYQSNGLPERALLFNNRILAFYQEKAKKIFLR